MRNNFFDYLMALGLCSIAEKINDSIQKNFHRKFSTDNSFQKYEQRKQRQTNTF
jgi:hypothetical protein